MKQIKLVGNDLGAVQFAVSPLVNLGLSVRALRLPEPVPGAGAAVADAVATMEARHREVLIALVTGRGWIPDFITPLPRGPYARIEVELDRLRATPPETVRADLAVLYPDGLPTSLTGPPELVRERVGDALTELWLRAVEPLWERMRAVLEADVLHRGRITTHDGMRAMLENLSDRVQVLGPAILVEVDRCCPCYNELIDSPLYLIPSVFAERTIVPCDPRAAPFLAYPARGAATVWERDAGEVPDHLGRLLGRVRAGLLCGLVEPDSTTRIAVQLGVTPSAANQHLRALRESGLVESRRCGRDVLYWRTQLGDALLAGSSATRDARGVGLLTEPERR